MLGKQTFRHKRAGVQYTFWKHPNGWDVEVHYPENNVLLGPKPLRNEEYQQLVDMIQNQHADDWEQVDA